MFAPVEDVAAHVLATEDGNRVYYEVFGNAQGVPLVFLHGGPGSGASVNQRRLFDPSLFRVVVVDQRGCGRSRPLAEDADDSYTTNTTALLIDDLEAIRASLGIDAWVLAGISWGTTLALAYALAHPSRCRGVVAALVSTGSSAEVRWLTRDVGRIFPREYETFLGAIPAEYRHLAPVDAYAEMLWGPDVALREAAALAWCRWEDAHVSLAPEHQASVRYQDPVFRLRFARLVTHYWRHACFLGDDEILTRAKELNGIPVTMLHGRYDVSSPLDIPWRLHRSIASSELVVLDASGHGDGGDFLPAFLAALSRTAGR